MPNTPKHNEKIEIPRFPTLMVVIASILTCVFLTWFGVYSVSSAKKLKEKIALSLHALELRGMILQLDDTLTASARMYASTGDRKWVEQYNYYDPILNNLVKEAGELIQTPELKKMAKQASDANASLESMERQAFSLVEKGNFTSAKQILFSPDYEAQKKLYTGSMEKYGRYLKEQAKGQINVQFKSISYIILILGLGFIASSIAWTFAFKRIRNWKKLLTKIMVNELRYKKDLEDSRSLLEERVKERTDELEILNKTLQNNEANLTKINLALRESETRFHLAIESTPVGMAILTLEGKFIDINQALCNLFGYSKEEMLNKTEQDITYPEDYGKELELTQQLLEEKIKSFQIDKRYIHKNGHIFWALLNVSLLRNQTKNPQIICQVQDISNRKKYEQEILDLNEGMSTALNELKQHDYEMGLLNRMNEMLQSCQSSKEAYSIIDLSAREIFSSEDVSGGLAIFNQQTQNMEIIGKAGKHPNLKNVFSCDDCWALRMGHVYVVENPKHQLVCRHFESAPLGGYICIPLIVRNKIIGLINQSAPEKSVISKSQQQLCIAFSDVTKLSLANIKLREDLQEQSIRDPLTELFNRRYLDETLPRELQRIKRGNEVFSVAMLDIDSFKHFNDDYGHEVGDEILKSIAQALLQNFRGSDIVCRYGGDEFVIILFEKNLNSIIQKLQNLQAEVQKTEIVFQNYLLSNITLSIGVAQAPKNGSTASDIIHAADNALYAAKNKGKNKVEVFQAR